MKLDKTDYAIKLLQIFLVISLILIAILIEPITRYFDFAAGILFAVLIYLVSDFVKEFMKK